MISLDKGKEEKSISHPIFNFKIIVMRLKELEEDCEYVKSDYFDLFNIEYSLVIFSIHFPAKRYLHQFTHLIRSFIQAK